MRLTETRLRTLARAARAKTLTELRRAGFFFPDSTVKRLAAEWLAKLRANTRVMTTSAALRTALVAGRYEDISRHQGEFEDAVVQGGLTLPQTLRERLTTSRRGLPPIEGLPRPVAIPQTTIVLEPGDFAQTEERTSEGDFASFPTERLFWLVPTPQPGSKTYFVRASVGMNSSADLSTMLVAPLDVPENVRQVEVEVAGWGGANEDEEEVCLPPFFPLGIPRASALMEINAERVAADGSTTIVAQWDDWVISLSPLPCSSTFPVPDPPPLSVAWPRTLRFFPPAGGGRYRLVSG